MPQKTTLQIGFIDDTPAELEMIKNLEHGQPGVKITGALTLEALQATGVHPDIIALDVSYVLGEDPDEERVGRLLGSPPAMLPLDGDRASVLRNAFGNSMLFNQFFADLQDATANHTRGGIRLARAVAEVFPDVPIVGYSRKTSVTGALVYLAATSAFGFFQKPNDPFSWENTAKLTRTNAGSLITAWRDILENSESWQIWSKEAAEELLSRPGILKDQAIREGLMEFLPEED